MHIILSSEDKELVINSLDFFPHLSLGEQQELISNSVNISFEKGQNIHDPSLNCLGVLLIKSGELRTYILSSDGREITLFRLFSKDICILSASCILTDITFDVFIEAIKPCECILINSVYFKSLIKKYIYAENFSLKVTANRFSDVMWAMEQILFFSFDKRLALFLHDEVLKTGENNIYLTHEQIAKYLGSAREVVSRMLKYFTQEQIIVGKRGYITVLDKDKLLKIING